MQLRQRKRTEGWSQRVADPQASVLGWHKMLPFNDAICHLPGVLARDRDRSSLDALSLALSLLTNITDEDKTYAAHYALISAALSWTLCRLEFRRQIHVEAPQPWEGGPDAAIAPFYRMPWPGWSYDWNGNPLTLIDSILGPYNPDLLAATRLRIDTHVRSTLPSPHPAYSVHSLLFLLSPDIVLHAPRKQRH